jgi:hypothetical protein
MCQWLPVRFLLRSSGISAAISALQGSERTSQTAVPCRQIREKLTPVGVTSVPSGSGFPRVTVKG